MRHVAAATVALLFGLSAIPSTAAAGSITVSPLAVNFGNQPVNTVSMPATVHIQNTGVTDLTVTNVVTGNAVFSVTGWPGGSPVVLAQGEILDLSVTFGPINLNVLNEKLTIFSDDPLQPFVTVSLSGTGTIAIISLSPDPVLFGGVAVGGSGDATLTVSNTGNVAFFAQLALFSGPDAGQFRTVSVPFPIMVPPATSQDITLRCSPTAPGARTATVTVFSNADNGPDTVELACTGTAPPTSCGAETVTVPDGRLTASVIPDGATSWFGASVRIGNAYSVEFKNAAGGDGPPGTLTLFSGDDACSGTTTLVTNETAGIDPAGSPGAARFSFTAAGTLTYFRARLENDSGTDMPLTFSWSDTTMFSPAWSTNGPFNAFYSFQNTTATDLHGALALLDTSGALLGTFPLSIPANQTAAANTASLGVVRNQTGTARFTHDGPPGAVVLEAAIANFSSNPAYVQPVKFEAVRQATH